METIRKSIFIVGFNDKDTKTQILTDDEIMEIIQKTVLTVYDGATFSNCMGLYKGDFEKSLKIEILWTESEKDIILCESLKKALNQECIYYETANVNACYI